MHVSVIVGVVDSVCFYDVLSVLFGLILVFTDLLCDKQWIR